ncbi:nuclear transport factor 2 family protein [Sphingobium sp. Sx8-8]|uniref:nuclear transport factor 2 family protein n=1 Tax=Sphingobium sp. Sx8-8 TaxID=2933617 RepID=UPI001F597FDE|nr:nuclear transport factor 2 family protein [Sphingobium sp. Sx8-8]
MSALEKADHPGRHVVLAFCDRLSSRDFAGMRALVTDDMTWFVPGRPDRINYAGLFTFDQILPNLEGFLGGLEDFSFSVIDTVAEGDMVVVEARSQGRLNGAIYDNCYLMKYKLRDGRILSLKEYLDHSNVAAFLEQLEIPAAS